MSTCGCRALEFKLKYDGQALPQLAGYLEAAGAPTVKTELAISWARLPSAVQPIQWQRRLTVARGFAAYLKTIDPETEVPPPDVFGARQRRPNPTSGPKRASPGCYGRPERSRRHCGRPATRRCWACSPSRACGSARRSRFIATTSTSPLA